MQNKVVLNIEMLRKSAKIVTKERVAERAATHDLLEKCNQKAAADKINKTKRDLASKEIKQKIKQELDKQQRNKTLSTARLEPETGDNLKISSNCITLKIEIGKPFGVKKNRCENNVNIHGRRPQNHEEFEQTK